MIVPLPPHVVAALSETSAASVTAILLPAYRVGDAVVLLPEERKMPNENQADAAAEVKP